MARLYLLIRLLFVKYVSFSFNSPLEEPKLISALSGKQAGKHVVHIACGSTYSAAITAEGELYTWGRGNYGRLGHGMLKSVVCQVIVSASFKHSFIQSTYD